MTKKAETQKKAVRMVFDFGWPAQKQRGKKMSDEVITVPDMSLTVRQMLEHHTYQPDGKIGVKRPLYFELPIPVIKDITDVVEYRKVLNDQIKAVNDFIEQEKAEKALTDTSKEPGNNEDTPKSKD